MSDKQESKVHFVPALVLESTATVQQRARNYAFYLRIRDGVPGHDREQGLKAFWFEVPGLPMFRLDPESDCYRRLVSYIVDHTDAKCDADDEVTRLHAENHRLTELVAAADRSIAMLKAGLRTAVLLLDGLMIEIRSATAHAGVIMEATGSTSDEVTRTMEIGTAGDVAISTKIAELRKLVGP